VIKKAGEMPCPIEDNSVLLYRFKFFPLINYVSFLLLDSTSKQPGFVAFQESNMREHLPLIQKPEYTDRT
jgi:hypothetical protein